MTKPLDYVGVHLLVRELQGPARDHRCRHCGQQAAHWCYDNADPAELTNADGYACTAATPRTTSRCARTATRLFDAAHVIERIISTASNSETVLAFVARALERELKHAKTVDHQEVPEA